MDQADSCGMSRRSSHLRAPKGSFAPRQCTAAIPWWAPVLHTQHCRQHCKQHPSVVSPGGGTWPWTPPENHDFQCFVSEIHECIVPFNSFKLQSAHLASEDHRFHLKKNKPTSPPHHTKCCSPSYIPLHKMLQCVYKYTNHTLCIHLLGYYLCFTWCCHWEVRCAAAKQLSTRAKDQTHWHPDQVCEVTAVRWTYIFLAC